jgi:hypothetical protein
MRLGFRGFLRCFKYPLFASCFLGVGRDSKTGKVRYDGYPACMHGLAPCAFEAYGKRQRLLIGIVRLRQARHGW